jgi:hypothetical protein
MNTDTVMTSVSAKQRLGTLRLRDKDTNAILLIPQPSTSPDDPLNWSVTLFEEPA